jgi:hypothetical protein
VDFEALSSCQPSRSQRLLTLMEADLLGLSVEASLKKLRMGLCSVQGLCPASSSSASTSPEYYIVDGDCVDAG